MYGILSGEALLLLPGSIPANLGDQLSPTIISLGDHQWFFRNGPPMIVTYATGEKTISVLAVPSEEHETVGLFFTLEVH